MNAHTSIEPDYHLSIHGSEGDLDNLLPHDAYEHEILIGKLTDNKMLERASMDKRPLNGHGRQLIDLCKITGMMILMADSATTVARASLLGSRGQVQVLLITHSVPPHYLIK